MQRGQSNREKGVAGSGVARLGSNRVGGYNPSAANNDRGRPPANMNRVGPNVRAQQAAADHDMRRGAAARDDQEDKHMHNANIRSGSAKRRLGAANAGAADQKNGRVAKQAKP